MTVSMVSKAAVDRERVFGQQQEAAQLPDLDRAEVRGQPELARVAKGGGYEQFTRREPRCFQVTEFEVLG